jgi:four helix bundle protein
MLRAVDSIGANIAESVGRGHARDSRNFLFYARGSVAETQHWIRVAIRRALLAPETVEQLRDTSTVLYKQLNAFIRAQKLVFKDELQ